MDKKTSDYYFSLISSFSKRYPSFADGRINYTDVPEAAAVTIFVRHKDKILLVKRSRHVSHYKELWQGVAGYLDENVSYHDKVLEELREEVSLLPASILKVTVGKHFSIMDENLNINWHVFPCVVDVNTDKISLDFEATEHDWIFPEEHTRFPCIPNIELSLRACSLLK